MKDVTNDRAIMPLDNGLLSVSGNTRVQNRDEIYQVHEIFQHKFEKEAPPEHKLLQREHKLFAVGSTSYKPRT